MDPFVAGAATGLAGGLFFGETTMEGALNKFKTGTKVQKAYRRYLNKLINQIAKDERKL